MVKRLADRKFYIAVLVMGYLLRGIVYHFFPPINEILSWITIVWPVLIIVVGLLTDRKEIDWLTILLGILLTSAILTSLIHAGAYVNRQVGDMVYPTSEDLVFSFLQMAALFFVCFRAPVHDDPGTYNQFLDWIALAGWLVINALMLGSVILFFCYVMNITLPGGFGGADQIFTYGHMGENMRFCGLFGYSNDGGNLSALAVLLGIVLVSRSRIPKLLFVLSLLLSVYTIYLLDVRTSVVELAVVGAVIAYRFLGRKIGYGKTAVLIVITATFLIGLTFAAKKDVIMERIAKVNGDPYEILRFLTTGRSYFWDMAVRGFLSSPLLGQGWLNGQIYQYFDGHNLFFNVLLWTGLFGILPLTAFAVILIRTVLKNKVQLKVNGLMPWVLLMIGVFVESMLDRAVLGTAQTGVETTFFWLAAGVLVYGIQKHTAADAAVRSN